MPARKSNKKSTPTPETTDTSKPAESTSDPIAAPPSAPQDKEPTTPDAKRTRGFNVSRPISNYQPPKLEETESEVADRYAFKSVDLKNPITGPGEPFVVTGLQNLKTGEVTYPALTVIKLAKRDAEQSTEEK